MDTLTLTQLNIPASLENDWAPLRQCIETLNAIVTSAPGLSLQTRRGLRRRLSEWHESRDRELSDVVHMSRDMIDELRVHTWRQRVKSTLSWSQDYVDFHLTDTLYIATQLLPQLRVMLSNFHNALLRTPLSGSDKKRWEEYLAQLRAQLRYHEQASACVMLLRLQTIDRYSDFQRHEIVSEQMSARHVKSLPPCPVPLARHVPVSEAQFYTMHRVVADYLNPDKYRGLSWIQLGVDPLKNQTDKKAPWWARWRRGRWARQQAMADPYQQTVVLFNLRRLAEMSEHLEQNDDACWRDVSSCQQSLSEEIRRLEALAKPLNSIWYKRSYSLLQRRADSLRRVVEHSIERQRDFLRKRAERKLQTFSIDAMLKPLSVSQQLSMWQQLANDVLSPQRESLEFLAQFIQGAYWMESSRELVERMRRHVSVLFNNPRERSDYCRYLVRHYVQPNVTSTDTPIYIFLKAFEHSMEIDEAHRYSKVVERVERLRGKIAAAYLHYVLIEHAQQPIRMDSGARVTIGDGTYPIDVEHVRLCVAQLSAQEVDQFASRYVLQYTGSDECYWPLMQVSSLPARIDYAKKRLNYLLKMRDVNEFQRSRFLFELAEYPRVVSECASTILGFLNRAPFSVPFFQRVTLWLRAIGNEDLLQQWFCHVERLRMQSWQQLIYQPDPDESAFTLLLEHFKSVDIPFPATSAGTEELRRLVNDLPLTHWTSVHHRLCEAIGHRGLRAQYRRQLLRRVLLDSEFSQHHAERINREVPLTDVGALCDYYGVESLDDFIPIYEDAIKHYRQQSYLDNPEGFDILRRHLSLRPELMMLIDEWANMDSDTTRQHLRQLERRFAHQRELQALTCRLTDHLCHGEYAKATACLRLLKTVPAKERNEVLKKVIRVIVEEIKRCLGSQSTAKQIEGLITFSQVLPDGVETVSLKRFLKHLGYYRHELPQALYCETNRLCQGKVSVLRNLIVAVDGIHLGLFKQEDFRDTIALVKFVLQSNASGLHSLEQREVLQVLHRGLTLSLLEGDHEWLHQYENTISQCVDDHLPDKNHSLTESLINASPLSDLMSALVRVNVSQLRLSFNIVTNAQQSESVARLLQAHFIQLWREGNGQWRRQVRALQLSLSRLPVTHPANDLIEVADNVLRMGNWIVSFEHHVQKLFSISINNKTDDLEFLHPLFIDLLRNNVFSEKQCQQLSLGISRVLAAASEGILSASDTLIRAMQALQSELLGMNHVSHHQAVTNYANYCRHTAFSSNANANHRAESLSHLSERNTVRVI